MTSRERWIVYPLLFLALGTSIKPKLVPPELRGVDLSSSNLLVNRVTCRELRVHGADARPRILLTAPLGLGPGEIRVSDGYANALVAIKGDMATRSGLIETLNQQGRTQTRLGSSESGGEILAYDNAERHAVGIAHHESRFGLLDTNLRTNRTISAPISELINE